MRVSSVTAKQDLCKALTPFSLEVRLSGSVCSTHSGLVRRGVRPAAVGYFLYKAGVGDSFCIFLAPGGFLYISSTRLNKGLFKVAYTSPAVTATRAEERAVSDMELG